MELFAVITVSTLLGDGIQTVWMAEIDFSSSRHFRDGDKNHGAEKSIFVSRRLWCWVETWAVIVESIDHFETFKCIWISYKVPRFLLWSTMCFLGLTPNDTYTVSIQRAGVNCGLLVAEKFQMNGKQQTTASHQFLLFGSGITFFMSPEHPTVTASTFESTPCIEIRMKL